MNEPTHLDLFSGIGGFALAAQWAGFRTIGFCEIDKYCQKVLAKNFRIHTNGDFLDYEMAEMFGNIKHLSGKHFAGVSLITGGFPCQPFSVAGKRRGAADDRHLWPEMLRVINEARPAWVLGENVSGIIPMELDNVLSDLEGIGYTTRSFVIPACAVDARHRRDRLWVVGKLVDDATVGRREQRNPESEPKNGSIRASVSDTEHASTTRQRQHCRHGLSEPESIRSSPCCWDDEREWSIKSGMGRVAYGIPSRVDRLKGLGNAIVPQVAYEILREIRNLIL